MEYGRGRVLGYRWVQGYGFEGFPFIAHYSTHQAAYGRIRRAERVLRELGLDDWYVSYAVTKVENEPGGKWRLEAEVKEIL